MSAEDKDLAGVKGRRSARSKANRERARELRVQGLGRAEIAERMGVSPGTLGNWLDRR